MPVTMAVIVRVRPQEQVYAATFVVIAVVIVARLAQQQVDRFLHHQERNEGQSSDEHGPRIYLIATTIATGKGIIERIGRIGQLVRQGGRQKHSTGGHVADREEGFGGVNDENGCEDGQEGGYEYGHGDDQLESVYAHVQ